MFDVRVSKTTDFLEEHKRFPTASDPAAPQRNWRVDKSRWGAEKWVSPRSLCECLYLELLDTAARVCARGLD